MILDTCASDDMLVINEQNCVAAISSKHALSLLFATQVVLHPL
jgi:hypothetical protein